MIKKKKFSFINFQPVLHIFKVINHLYIHMYVWYLQTNKTIYKQQNLNLGLLVYVDYYLDRWYNLSFSM